MPIWKTKLYGVLVVFTIFVWFFLTFMLSIEYFSCITVVFVFPAIYRIMCMFICFTEILRQWINSPGYYIDPDYGMLRRHLEHSLGIRPIFNSPGSWDGLEK